MTAGEKERERKVEVEFKGVKMRDGTVEGGRVDECSENHINHT